jgi:hypothetical protein
MMPLVSRARLDYKPALDARSTCERRCHERYAADGGNRLAGRVGLLAAKIAIPAQGDVFWLTFRGVGSKPDRRRPALVIQHDRFNRSAINTTIVAAITSGSASARRGWTGLVW